MADEHTELRMTVLRAEVALLRRLVYAAVHVTDPSTLRAVTVEAIVSYLVARGWQRAPWSRANLVEYTREPETPGLYQPSITLSLQPTWRDYAVRVAEVLRDIAAVYGRKPHEVLAELLPQQGPWNDPPAVVEPRPRLCRGCRARPGEPHKNGCAQPTFAGCDHNWFEPGPRVPLRRGSSSTDICCACGAWRTNIHTLGPWRTAETLAATLEPDDEC